MIKVKTTGRIDTDDFFTMGLQESKSYPFLVFKCGDKKVSVKQETRVTDVLEYSDDTRVMQQWPGEWKSDFFQFSVGDLRTFRNKEKSDVVDVFPEIEFVNVRVNCQGRVEYVDFVYLDRKHHLDKPMSFHNSEKAMKIMEEALDYNPKMVKVTQNSRSYGKLPEKKYDGNSWLKKYESCGESWGRIMSQAEKKRLGLA